MGGSSRGWVVLCRTVFLRQIRLRERIWTGNLTREAGGGEAGGTVRVDRPGQSQVTFLVWKAAAGVEKVLEVRRCEAWMGATVSRSQRGARHLLWPLLRARAL